MLYHSVLVMQALFGALSSLAAGANGFVEGWKVEKHGLPPLIPWRKVHM
jgi:hypothetical protein